MNLYLIRHGETDHNKGLIHQSVTDIALNETGLIQADQLGRRLKGYGIERIYSSHLKRARQTAEMINSYVKASIQIAGDLQEINMGEWEGADWSRIQRDYPEYYREWREHTWDMPYPGGESGAEVDYRTRRVLTEIQETGLRDVAIVSHGGVIKIILSKVLGMGLEKRFRLEIGNCSLNVIRYDRARQDYLVRCINDTGHLENSELP